MSFLATIVLYLNKPFSVSTFSFFYLLTILLIFIYAFKGQIQISKITITKQFKYIAIGFTVILIPATFFYGYYASLTLLYVDLSSSRYNSINLIPPNIFNTIFAFFSTLYFVPMFLYFLFYSAHRHKLLRIIMFVSTLSYPLLTICYSGRDGVLYWIMNMVTYFFLFRKYMHHKDFNKIRRYFFVVFCVFVTIFIIISIARFSHKEGGTLYALIGYLGQQTKHFSVAFENVFFEGKGTLFPGWHKLLGIDVSENDIMDYVNQGLLEEYHTFSFFVKPIVNGYGKISALFIATIFAIIVQYFIKNYAQNKNYIDLMIVITLFQIPMNGLFYYRQGIGNGDVIYSLFLIVLLLSRRIRSTNI